MYTFDDFVKDRGCRGRPGKVSIYWARYLVLVGVELQQAFPWREGFVLGNINPRWSTGVFKFNVDVCALVETRKTRQNLHLK